MADIANLVVRVTQTGADSAAAGLGKLGGAAGAVGIAAAKAVTAIAATSAAITTMTLAAAKANQETENLARQVKLTASEFKSLEFAAKKFGVTGDQIADISKDLSDKLGEFATAGTGAFQDFVDVMGMTKEEGVALARDLQNLSGDQVVGQLVSRMEAAGASTNQMTFALESMGNDLSKLLPLFAKNSAELNKLRSGYDEINKQMAITSTQSASLQELSGSWDLLSASIGTATTSISATVAPVLTGFFNDVVTIVPQAEQVIVDFLNRFKEVEAINSIEAVNIELERQNDILARTQWSQDAFEKKTLLTGKAQDQQMTALMEYNEAQERANQLIKQRTALEEKMAASKLADAKKVQLGTSGVAGGIPGTSKSKGSTTIADDIERRKQAAQEMLAQLQQANMTELQFIKAKEEELSSIAKKARDDDLISEEQYQNALLEIRTSAIVSRERLESEAAERGRKEADALFESQMTGIEKWVSATEKAMSDYDAMAVNAAENFTTGFGQAFSSAITGAESVGDAFKGMFDGMASALLSYVGEWIAQQTLMWALDAAFNKTAATSSAVAMTSNAAAQSTMAGLAAFSSTAAIPVVGPALAPAAAAAAIAATAPMAAAVGLLASSAAAAREQGGYMTGGTPYQMAERGKAELVIPSGNSRAKTIAQMREMMGGTTSNSVSNNVTINSSGNASPEAIARAVDRVLRRKSKKTDNAVYDSMSRGRRNKGGRFSA